ncbi:MAG: glycine dehydrogenase (aminomethyl-transferring), partial [Betaproteobacteria bacterium]
MTTPATQATLSELENHGEFIARHIGPDDTGTAQMLKAIGATSLDDMIQQVAPASIRKNALLDLPAAMSEAEALAEMRRMAGRNKVLKSYIGQGYYGTHTPGVILRNILENPAWYTAYTPYQPEISQGR